MAVVGTAALVITAAGCHPHGPAAGGKGDSQGGGSKSKTLVVGGYDGPTVQRNFNPFSPKGNDTGGLVYQNLFDFNMVKDGKFMPALGTKYNYSKDGKRVTIKLDDRATWADGGKLTSKDVVFSLKYEKKNGVLGFDFDKTEAKGKHSVIIDFKKRANVLIQDVGQTLIIPKKIWKDHNAKKWTNPHPMGSGAYKMSRFTSQRVTFSARDDYWGKKASVPKVAYTVLGDQTPQQLLKHEMDATGGGQPNIKKNFVDKNRKQNHLWPVPIGAHVLVMNTKRKPFNNIHARRAISAALDREDIANAYNPGEDKAVSPTGLEGKEFSDWIPKKYRSPLKQDITKAKHEFTKAGYKQRDGKLVDAHGKQLSMSLKEVSDYTDAMTYDKATMSQLKKLGIKAKVTGESDNAWQDDADHYKYDMVLETYNYGLPSPYRFYNDMLRAHRDVNTTKDHGNQSRWNDPATEKALDGLQQASSTKGQRHYVHKLQKVMDDEVPAIPTTTRAWPCQYTTTNWKGWPTKSKPYAMCYPHGGVSDYASNAKVLQKLHPANQGG